MNAVVDISPESRNTSADIKRALIDPVFHTNHFLWTFDPRPEAYPHHLPFKLYPFQEELITEVLKAIREGYDLLIEKSRDMGVSWCVLGTLYWLWKREPGFQALLGSRKEDLVDSKKIESLFGKIDYFIEKDMLWPEAFDQEKNRTYMTLVNPMNGNVIGGESANANFARQGRYTAVMMDEIAFWESPETAWTAAGESTRCRIGITTPPKRPNFITYLRRSGKVKVITLHWSLHPAKDAAWYEAQKARKLPEEIAQELDINWEGSITGRVYPEVSHVRLGDFPYRYDWPLYVSHDPGHRPDPHATGYFQVNPENGRIRLVESMEVREKIAEWFGPFFGFPIDSQFAYTPDEHALIEKVGQWKRGTHFGDPYGRTGNQVTGTSLYDEWLDKYSIYVGVNTLKNDLDSRKTDTKKVLMRLDVNDTPNNRFFLECVKNAQYPHLSESSNRLTPNDKPIHDWTSHNRTMLEFFSVNYNDSVEPEEEIVDGTFLAALSSIQSKNTTSEEYIIQ